MSLRADKFSSTASADAPDILQGKTPEEFLADKYVDGCIFGLDNLMQSGVYRIHGWSYNFRPYLKTFLYKQYDRWTEVYAPNKTVLRKVVCGRIDRIVEIPQE